MNTVKLMKVLKALKKINARMIMSFAVGLLTASIVIGIVYLSSSDDGHEAEEATSLTEEEMKEKLSAAGYLIHTEEEWDEMVVSPVPQEEAEGNENDEKKEEEEKEEEKEETTRKTSITVSEGMTSIDIGEILEDEGFIDDAYEFTNRVEESGVANKLQLGTYEIDSTMTMDEIITELFN